MTTKRETLAPSDVAATIVGLSRRADRSVGTLSDVLHLPHVGTLHPAAACRCLEHIAHLLDRLPLALILIAHWFDDSIHDASIRFDPCTAQAHEPERAGHELGVACVDAARALHAAAAAVSRAIEPLAHAAPQPSQFHR